MKIEINIDLRRDSAGVYRILVSSPLLPLEGSREIGRVYKSDSEATGWRWEVHLWKDPKWEDTLTLHSYYNTLEEVKEGVALQIYNKLSEGWSAPKKLKP